MSHLFFYLQLILFFSPLAGMGQVSWDGGAGTGEWNDPANWSADQLPGASDEVILDNSVIQGSYIAYLPGGTASVTVKSISIHPVSGNHIELVLPAGNTMVPALTTTGPGYGLHLYSGAIFRNASGASSGTPVSVADSIRIDNGARYVHNTERGHAENVAVLSAAPGTENGILEFSVPAASSTISLSGRRFGSVVMDAAAQPGDTVKYTAAGTNKVIIRGDLLIGNKVSCGLNFSDSLIVEGSLIDSGIFDMGNTSRSVVVAVQKNIVQSTGGVIAGSGGAGQEIVLDGRDLQHVDMRGKIINQIGFSINNAGNIALASSLRVPDHLTLLKGQLITSASSMLELEAGASIFCDTVLGKSFVNGPMKKMGLVNADFIFPVGAGTAMRWIGLSQATGDFTVNYIPMNPNDISSILSAGVNHISQIEYWTIRAAGAARASVIASFRDPQSGGVTSLAELRVARLVGNRWENAGNRSTGGSAGSEGWVSSDLVSGFSAGDEDFALASATGQENPLPFTTLVITAAAAGNGISIHCLVDTDEPLSTLELQRGDTENIFHTVSSRSFDIKEHEYHFEQPAAPGIDVLFRICAVGARDRPWVSNTVVVHPRSLEEFRILSVHASGNSLIVSATSRRAARFEARIYTLMGQCVGRMQLVTTSGQQTFQVPILTDRPGIYLLHAGLPDHLETFPFARSP